MRIWIQEQFFPKCCWCMFLKFLGQVQDFWWGTFGQILGLIRGSDLDPRAIFSTFHHRQIRRLGIKYDLKELRMNVYGMFGKGSPHRRGVPVPPLFGLRGTVPKFSGRKGEEFDVTCCQQKRFAELNYNKTIFGRGSAPDPAWSQMRRGYTSSPFSSPLASGPKDAPFSFWIGTPTFQTKVTPLVALQITNGVGGGLNSMSVF